MLAFPKQWRSIVRRADFARPSLRWFILFPSLTFLTLYLGLDLPLMMLLRRCPPILCPMSFSAPSASDAFTQASGMPHINYGSHGEVRPARFVIASGLCPVCFKQFPSRLFAIRHSVRSSCIMEIDSLLKLTATDCDELDKQNRVKIKDCQRQGVHHHRGPM